MREFFRGWKRKIGIVTLLMACASSVGWIRSVSRFDCVTVSVGPSVVVAESYDQGIVCAYSCFSEGRKSKESWCPRFISFSFNNHLEALNGSVLFDLDVAKILDRVQAANSPLADTGTSSGSIDDDDASSLARVRPSETIVSDCFPSGFKSAKTKSFGSLRVGSIAYNWGHVDFAAFPYWIMSCPLAVMSAYLVSSKSKSTKKIDPSPINEE